jgi:hypothetical protein
MMTRDSLPGRAASQPGVEAGRLFELAGNRLEVLGLRERH